jgi:Protein of unknown function (DUF551)
VSEWQPIDTAPKDGTWFMICRAEEGFETYEVGRYQQLMWPKYIPVGDNLFKQIKEQIYEWRGFNNMHRATHWMPLPKPPENSLP